LSGELIAGLATVLALVLVFVLAIFDKRAGSIHFGIFFSRLRDHRLDEDEDEAEIHLLDRYEE
jgi:hypothetical protein